MTYVEDYLEYIAGINSFGVNSTSLISLARYDVNIVHSMAQQTLTGLALTDRQAALAHKIVVKYKRQLAVHGIDLGAIEHQPQYRLKIRTIDRAKEILLDQNQIVLKFPYEPELVKYVQETSRGIHGSFAFDHESKSWRGAITEPRLLWLETLADKYQFTVDEQLKKLIQQVHEQISSQYQIQLVPTNSGFEIINAETTLIDYIENNLGGLDQKNILKLIDYSSILGYQVHDSVVNEYLGTYSPAVQTLFLNKEPHLPNSQIGNLESIVEYTQLAGHEKIFVYDPMNSPVTDTLVLTKLKNLFGDSLLAVSPTQRKFNTDGYRCIYLTNWMPSWNIRIPLLLTFTAMMIGPKKQHIIQCADKVVYCTETVYNTPY